MFFQQHAQCVLLNQLANKDVLLAKEYCALMTKENASHFSKNIFFGCQILMLRESQNIKVGSFATIIIN